MSLKKQHNEAFKKFLFHLTHTRTHDNIKQYDEALKRLEAEIKGFNHSLDVVNNKYKKQL